MVERFFTLDEFLKNRKWPKTRASLNHLINKKRREMTELGILKKFDGLLFIDPKKFDEWIFGEEV